MSGRHDSPSPEGHPGLAAAINRAGFALYPELSRGKNAVFSPLGIHCLLRALYEAAGGETRLAWCRNLDAELVDPQPLRTLLDHLDSLTRLTDDETRSLREAAELRQQLVERGEWSGSFSEPGSEDDLRLHLSIANGIWVKTGLECKQRFLDATRAMMPLDIGALDFEPSEAACEHINAWLRERSLGRIEAMVSPAMLPPFTRAVLGNAIYFKARWEQGFYKSKPGHFYVADGNRVQAQMMVGVFSELNYTELGELWAVELPYSRRPISMAFIVPAQHGDEALRSLEARLEQRWSEIVDSEDRPTDVILTLPEVVVRGEHRLGPALRHLGLTALFEEPDFSGISDEPGFRIDEILHNTILSVDRYGTESTAAAVTPTFGRSSLPERVVLTIDRPFLFAVLDKVSGVILYLGKVEHPD